VTCHTALIGLVLCSSPSGQGSVVATPGARGVALAVAFGGFAAARWIASLGETMGWRGRCLTTLATRCHHRSISRARSNGHELKTYPAIVDNLMALLTVAGDDRDCGRDLMLHDAQALATMFVLAGIAVALMLCRAR